MKIEMKSMKLPKRKRTSIIMETSLYYKNMTYNLSGLEEVVDK